ncbi:RlmF-related methyltransferase [Aeromonas sp. A-5]|uniref:RlmF-related methyltransferase n=1 Tax=Aeromonas ichthyocola TaxID=3367746 RepID=UPI0038E514A6
MINQSKEFASQCLWFSSLVSKKGESAGRQKGIGSGGARQVRVLEMAQGNKVSRVLAWSFLDDAGMRAVVCPAAELKWGLTKARGGPFFP